jgi:isorenieratene synthase
VAVVGGGVAGLSAAIELADRGAHVILLEQGDQLGGKVKGWWEKEEGTDRWFSMEHGLHGWWLDYTNFRDLLARLGIAGNLTEPVGPLTVIHRSGAVDTLRFGDLPSPLHALALLRSIRSVGLRGKLSMVRAGAAIAAFDPAATYRDLDGVDFRSWLRRVGVSSRATEMFFEPTLRSNLFLPPEQLSAAAGINAIQRGLRHRNSWRFAWLKGNTRDFLWGPAERHLRDKGVEIRLAAKVISITLDHERVTKLGIEHGAEPATPLDVEYVVLAMDIESCKGLVRSSLSHIPFFAHLANLKTTDVLVTRSWFHGDVRLPYRDAMLIGFRVVDVLIDVTRFQPGVAAGGAVVIETQSYLGKQWMHVPASTVEALVLRDLYDVLPALENAEHIRTVPVRHPGLFTAFAIEFDRFRPSTHTPVRNLYMAGDWVKADEAVMFMENAVVTGRRAASAVLEDRRAGSVPVLPGRPADWPVRALQYSGRVARRARHAVDRFVGFERIGT